VEIEKKSKTINQIPSKFQPRNG